MAEYILGEFLRWRNNIQIAIILDEKFLQIPEADVSVISEKFKTLGKIKAALVVTDKQLRDAQYTEVTNGGFTVKIVPEGNVTLDYLLEAYDLVLASTCDIIVFGTENEELLPLFTDTRNRVKETFALVSKDVSPAFINAFDDVIKISELAEYSFTATADIELDKNTDLKSVQKKECEHLEDIIGMGPVSEE